MNVFDKSKNITPGTEKTAENAREYRFIPTDNGIKYDTALTAHKAPTPPNTLENIDLKKCPLFLYTKSIIQRSTAPVTYIILFILCKFLIHYFYYIYIYVVKYRYITDYINLNLSILL
jgi:hypothetical protein